MYMTHSGCYNWKVCDHPQAVYQCEDESLWVWGDALLFLDLGLDC